MTREVSRENSQDALDKDPRAVRPDMAKQPDPDKTLTNAEIAGVKTLNPATQEERETLANFYGVSVDQIASALR